MSTPGRGRIRLSSPPQPPPPPMPPLGNIQGTGNVPVELPNLAGGASGNDDMFEEDFLRSLPSYVDGNDGGILDDVGLADPTNHSPALNRSLFEDGIAELLTCARVAVKEAVAALTNLASFPSNFGTLQNRFTNQNSDLNDEGYDSEGNLPHFADANINDDMEEYNEASIEVGGGEAPAVAGAPAASLVAAHVPLDVMGLTVARLREELRKRGRATGRNKSTMQERLKEAIKLNVPVLGESGVNEARRPDFMAGLDVTARWELMTWCEDPVPEPGLVP
jgi:hypothetical protein